MTTTPGASRVLLVGAGATATAGAAALLAGPRLAALLRRTSERAGEAGWWAALDASPPADLLSGLAAAVLLGCAGWLWAAAVATLVRVAGGADPHRAAHGVPAVLHRAVLASCGLAVAGAVLSPAAAVPTPLHRDPRPVPLHAGASAQAPTRAPTVAGTWTVRRGDTLWAIARASLTRHGSPGPPPQEIAARVRVLHHLNRDAVPHPDLIYPAQRLRLPTA